MHREGKEGSRRPRARSDRNLLAGGSVILCKRVAHRHRSRSPRRGKGGLRYLVMPSRLTNVSRGRRSIPSPRCWSLPQRSALRILRGSAQRPRGPESETSRPSEPSGSQRKADPADPSPLCPSQVSVPARVTSSTKSACVRRSIGGHAAAVRSGGASMRTPQEAQGQWDPETHWIFAGRTRRESTERLVMGRKVDR
jgi:hypothetical protein